MKKPLVPSVPWREGLRDLPHDRLDTLLATAHQIRPTINGRYRHWDSLRHKSPPGDLSVEEWWIAIKLARSTIAQPLPLLDTEGRPFTVAAPSVVQKHLRRIDRDSSGRISVSEAVTNPSVRERYLVSSLIEEAITSSQMEGANTSRRVAKEMIRAGRDPRTRSEQMILNNFQAMNFVRDRAQDPLTPSVLLELHRIVTHDTLDDSDDAGRFQPADDVRVRVWDQQGNVLHTPPDADELPARIRAMCNFANGNDEGDDDFVHPVVRSIVLHFWLAHDHPFADGNGRTARALFYWSMLHHGYWLTEFLTISSILKKGKAKYERSFLYSEWDDNDLTYFVLHQLDVLGRAIDGLHDYLERKMQEVRETEALLDDTTLNHRQIALLQHALRTPGATYTFKSHARSHGVVYQSARNDLLDMVDRGLLRKRRTGRAFTFYPAKDLHEQL